MRILIITNMFPNSNVPISGIGLYQAAKHLRKMGHEFHVIYPLNELPFPLSKLRAVQGFKPQVYPQHEEFDGIPIDFIPYQFSFRLINPRFWGQIVWFQIEKRLSEIAEDFRPDLIWSQTAIPNSWAAMKLSRKLGIPYAVMIHGADLNHVVHLRGAKTPIKKVYEKAESLIVISKRLRIEAQEVAPAASIKLVHFGVDMEMLQTAIEERQRWLNEDKSPENCTVLSVCRVSETKGIQYNIEVMKRLKDKLPGLTYRIVGDGDFIGEIKKMVLDSGLEDRVDFVGYKPFEAAKLEMARADFFSMPSYKEGLGLAYLESMALGIPTIAIRGQGGEDLITDGVDGFLVDPHDVDQLTAIWEKLISDADLRKRIGDAGKKKVLKNFTWEICSQKLEAAFKQTVSGS